MRYFKQLLGFGAVFTSCAFLLAGAAIAATDAKAPDLKPKTADVSADAAKPENIAPAPLPIPPGEYLAGKIAQSSGDRVSATRYTKDALRRDPNNKQLTLQLYNLLLMQGDVAGALATIHGLGDRVGDSFAPELLLATEKVKQGDFAGAQAMLGKMKNEQAGKIILPILKAWLKVGLKDVKKPLDFADLDVIKENNNVPFVAYHLALLNDAAGFHAEAEDYFDQALDGVKKIPYRVYEEAMSFYIRNGKKDKSSVLSARYKAQNPDVGTYSEPVISDKQDIDGSARGFAEVFYSLGSVLASSNSLQEEEMFLSLALYLQPDFPSVQYLLASALEQEENYDAAIGVYKTINPKSSFYLRGRIRTAYDLSLQKKRPEALVMLTELSKQYPKNLDVLLTRGDIFRNAERFADAAAAYGQAIAAIGKPQAQDWPVYYSRGICFERANQWSKAEADFLRALELSPGQPDVLNYLGYSWLLMGRNLDKAKEMVEQALEARPDDMHIIDSMGFALLATGDFDSAAEYLEQAVELAPNDPTVNEHLGDVYWRLGRKTEARFQWDRALTFKPDAAQEKTLRQKLANGLAPISEVHKKTAQTSQEHVIVE